MRGKVLIMASVKKEALIAIRPIVKKEIRLRIVGDSPLITHCWDAKAKRQILEKELGIKSVRGNEKKNPVADFASSMYWLDPMPTDLTEENVNTAIQNGARFGFPLTGVKQAAISAAYRMGWSKDKASLRGSFFVKPEFDGYYAGDLVISDDKKSVDIVPNAVHPEPMIEIHAESVKMREDMVKVGMGAADIRYRGQFENWWSEFSIVYNENGDKTIDEIITILNAGGYVCGLGEWRPERDGQYGMFHVEIESIR